MALVFLFGWFSFMRPICLIFVWLLVYFFCSLFSESGPGMAVNAFCRQILTLTGDGLLSSECGDPVH